MKTLILDNYDSFTFNLMQYVGELDEEPTVRRNDCIGIDEVGSSGFDRIIISPGPGTPEDPAYFGICRDVILRFGSRIPILGVCLGHQGIIHAFGGKIVRAQAVMHGKTSYVFHNDTGVFCGLPRAFEAMRYHSLVGAPDSVPDVLEVNARTWDGVIMGVRHRTWPVYGVQFHPESIGTGRGRDLLRTFLSRGAELAGQRVVDADAPRGYGVAASQGDRRTT